MRIAFPRRPRGLLARGLAGLVVTAIGIGSLALAAASASTLATATPSGPAPSSPPPAVASLASPYPSATAAPIATPTATPDPTATPTPVAVVPTAAPTAAPVPTPSVHETFVAVGTEPTVAADPFHPGVVAVIVQTVYAHSLASGCSQPSVRISRDAGATWGPASYPWGTQCQDMHAVIAWGPNSRLWAGDAVGVVGGVGMAVTYTDNMGKSWTGRYVEHFTKPWSGCYPALTVDNRPDSPNFGTVYVAYNWLPNSYGPGVALMASRTGATWYHAEVKVTTLTGYPYAWRIGYRIEAAPDGTAVVSYYQSSLHWWDENNMFGEGSGSNIGSRGFETVRVHFDGRRLWADAPVHAVSVDHASASWQSQLAIADSGKVWLAVENGVAISVGSPGGTWQKLSVAGKSSFKPSLAIGGGTIFVGWHAEDPDGKVWTYYTLSFDGGVTFLPPALATNATWYPNSVADHINGVGLRENADFSNGLFYYAYGDARSGLGVFLATVTP
jgi:hypothetical protein